MPATGWPFSAEPISSLSAFSAARSVRVLGAKPGMANGFSPGFRAGGSGVASTRSVAT